jgi:hypothetical protein
VVRFADIAARKRIGKPLSRSSNFALGLRLLLIIAVPRTGINFHFGHFTEETERLTHLRDYRAAR